MLSTKFILGILHQIMGLLSDCQTSVFFAGSGIEPVRICTVGLGSIALAFLWENYPHFLTVKQIDTAVKMCMFI